MKKSCVKYFKNRAEAEKHAASIALSDCINRGQMSGDTQSPKIIEFKRGFAIQLGDCGEFCLTTKE